MTSVLDTQKRLHKLEDTRRALEEGLRIIRERIEKAKEAHREQIAKSLNSKNPEEKRMAESVRQWWDVPIPPTQ